MSSDADTVIITQLKDTKTSRVNQWTFFRDMQHNPQTVCHSRIAIKYYDAAMAEADCIFVACDRAMQFVGIVAAKWMGSLLFLSIICSILPGAGKTLFKKYLLGYAQKHEATGIYTHALTDKLGYFLSLGFRIGKPDVDGQLLVPKMKNFNLLRIAGDLREGQERSAPVNPQGWTPATLSFVRTVLWANELLVDETNRRISDERLKLVVKKGGVHMVLWLTAKPVFYDPEDPDPIEEPLYQRPQRQQSSQPGPPVGMRTGLGGFSKYKDDGSDDEDDPLQLLAKVAIAME